MTRGTPGLGVSSTGDGDVKNATGRRTMCATPTFPVESMWCLVMWRAARSVRARSGGLDELDQYAAGVARVHEVDP